MSITPRLDEKTIMQDALKTVTIEPALLQDIQTEAGKPYVGLRIGTFTFFYRRQTFKGYAKKRD